MAATPLRLSRRALLGSVAGLSLLAAGCSPSAPPAFHALDITGADYARGFELPDPDGRVRTLAEFKGRLVIVFFGFTQCPDVCPTALLQIAQARQQLGADGARVQGVFVTVDPERDTPAVLKAYVGNFGADFVALRGSAEQTQALAKDFKVFYAKVPGKTEGSYSMDHTAGAYVFDTQGRIRLFTRHGAPVDALVGDLKRLLAETR